MLKYTKDEEGDYEAGGFQTQLQQVDWLSMITPPTSLPPPKKTVWDGGEGGVNISCK